MNNNDQNLNLTAEQEIASALQFFLESLKNARTSRLRPRPDYSDWATVEFRAKRALARLNNEELSQQAP